MTNKTLSALEEVIAYKRGNKNLEVVTITPQQIDVRSMREHMGLTQEEFASRYGFTISTLRNWEQGRRQPEGPARVLLKLIEERPELVEEVLCKHRV